MFMKDTHYEKNIYPLIPFSTNVLKYPGILFTCNETHTNTHTHPEIRFELRNLDITHLLKTH